jgi:eukaryotic-like serine/threonine-protein kinase
MLVPMTSAPPPDDGRLLDGRYRLGTLLGAGGAAEVYRAVDERLSRGVAVKLFRGDVAEQLQRHEEEMRTLARLNHGSLVTVFDAGTDEQTGQPYLVMALVEGSTLADQLRTGPLTPLRTAEIGAAVADALAYVHGQGLVHRDVKPANVLISNAGRVFLADFGIARLVDSAHVTQAGDVLGTPAFFAPEQVSGEQVGPPADVYALGLVLLECLTGRREYDGTTLEVAMARLSRPPNVPPSLSPAWRDLLLGMTAQQPGARLSAAQVATRLQRLADGDDRLPPASAADQATAVIPRIVPTAVTTVMPPVPPPPTTTVTTVAPPPPSNARRFWVVVLLLLLVIVVAAAVAIAVIKHNDDSSTTTCSAGTSGLSGQLQDDMTALNGAACSNDVASKAASVFSPDLVAVRTAAAGTSRKTLRAAVSQIKSDAEQLESQGQITTGRQQAVEDAAGVLQSDFLVKHPVASPSSSPSESQTPTTPVTTPPVTPTVTTTVTTTPTSPPTTDDTTPPDSSTATP